MTPAPDERLDATFFDRPVVEVARDLVGCSLYHGGVGGIVVETEAYHESEPACHAYSGPTPRARTLFREPGVAYVYFSYGVHSLFNVVCEPAGTGAAVLIRALEPVAGVRTMRRRRGRDRLTDLCSGPGKLTQALAIGLTHNESTLARGPIGIYRAHGDLEDRAIESSPRVGITRATELPWRFCLAGNGFVSR
jgi:DNA-3-methyladenine glycosylase